MTLDWALISETLPLLTQGTLVTLQLSAITAVAALAGGAVLAALHASAARLPRLAAQIFIGAMRGIPPLVLVLIAFYVLPALGLLLDPMTAGVVALASYFSAYVAIALGAAVAAIPAGQNEAALVIGMRPRLRLIRVILPQALPIALPVLCGLLIGLIKETALLSVISVGELTFATKQAVSRTYAPFEVYMTAAMLYWAISAALEAAARALEHRTTRFRRSASSSPKGRFT
jgi:His/Glu/Gln/Arg/opine family amino acid ABC transporter permease subunit